MAGRDGFEQLRKRLDEVMDDKPGLTRTEAISNAAVLLLLGLLATRAVQR